MKSRRTREYKLLLSRLPRRVQVDAQDAWLTFKGSPEHPSLGTKRITVRLGGSRTMAVLRIELAGFYRAMYFIDRSAREPVAIWFWVGSHGDYDKQF